MSNKTQTLANSVRGQNPQFLIEAVVRNKIYQNRYWKEKLPGLTAASIIDEAIELQYVSGTYGGSRKPSKFIMLALKLLQISPEKDEVLEYINSDFKYLTALGCFYIRLVQRAEDVYKMLEPLYLDYRKLRIRNVDGSFDIIHMDEFVDNLLTQEAYLDTLLPHIQQRHVLESTGALKERISPLEQILLDELKKEEEEKKRIKALQSEQAQNEEGEQADNKQNDEEDRREQKKKHKKHRSRSPSSSRERKDKKRKHKSGNDWKKIIKGKHKSNNHKRDRSRSNSKSPQKQSGKEPAKDSVEYWNKIRAEMGIQLL